MYKVPPCRTCEQSFYVRAAEIKGRGDSTGRAPLVLDCGHNFCEQCISKMTAKKHIVCHTCKAVTPMKEGRSVKSMLPINPYIVGQTVLNRHLLLDDSVLKMVPKVMKTPSPGVKPVKTRLPKQEPCSECSVNAATCKCNKCDCVLCGACFDKVHQASKMLRTHQAIPLYESDRYEKIATVCPEHDNRPIEYFCEDDQMAICSHCVIVGKHQNHAINSIEDKNKEAVKKIEPALNHAHTIFQMLKRSDKQLHGVIPHMQRDVRGVIEDIRNGFLHVHSLLVAREKAMIQQVEMLCQDEVTPIEDLRLKVSEDLQKVASITRDAAKLKQSASMSVLNAQAILESLIKLEDMPCYADIQTAADSKITVELDEQDLRKSIQSYGRLEGRASVSIKMLNIQEVPDDLLETSSVASDSTSAVSSERPSLPKETVEGSEGDAPVDTVSILSDVSAAESADSLPPHSCPKGLRRSRINLSRTEMVCVTHIKNPGNFMIQKLAVMEDLNKLSRRINQHCAKPATVNEIPLNGLEPEAIVLAQFHSDSRWYRARVLTFEVNEEEPLLSQVEVMYVDYGNSEIVPLSRIRKIPSKFMKMPALAMRCALKDILPSNDNLEWTLDSIKCFAGLINDKPILCIVKSEKDGVLQVDLSVPPDDKMEWDQPESVRDTLVFMEHGVFKSSEATPLYPGGPLPNKKRHYLMPSRLSPGTEVTCIISHVNDPHDFFIQKLGEDAEYLEQMTQQLQDEYNAPLADCWTIYCPRRGELCVAQYTMDDKWCRAEVIATPGRRNVEVLYVDYGNTEVVPFWRLKKIDEKFLVLAVQGLRCSLMDVDPVDKVKGWQEEAVTFMKGLSFKALSVCVAGYGTQHLQVVLNETSPGQNICINATLVQHGYACSTGPTSFHDEIQVVPEKLISTSPPSQFQDPLKAARKAASSMMSISEAGIRPISSTSSSPIPRSCSPSVTKVKSKSESPKPSAKVSGNYKPAEKKRSQKKEGSGPKSPHSQIVISKVVSPGHFYIQIYPTDELSEMMVNIQNHYRGVEPQRAIWSPGDYCVALRPEDVRWYRAKILEMKNDEVKVLLPDYGFTETVPEIHLRQLDDQFHNQPMQCIRCHLAEICPAGDITKWSQTSCETFSAIVKESKCYIVPKGATEDDSLPVDVLVREFIPGDALNPDRTEYNSVGQKLLKKGVALPNRMTIGRLVAAEEAKASLVTIPPKPLVPNINATADECLHEKEAEPKSEEPLKEDDIVNTAESQVKEDSPLLEIEDDILTGAKMDWAAIVEEESEQQESEQQATKDGEQVVSEDGKESKPSEQSDLSQGASSPPSASEVPKNSSQTEVQIDTQADQSSGSEKEGRKDSISELDESDDVVSPPKRSKSSRRSKGTSISEKLKIQQEKKLLKSRSEETKQAAGDNEAVKMAKKTSEVEKSPLKDDEVLKELEGALAEEPEEVLPETFAEAALPTSQQFEVVSTYVDYNCVIYGHIVPQTESREGRYGFILKENTLETIMQEKYLERQGLFRAKIPRDGNCLFRAFAQGVYQDQSKQGDLRKSAVEAMERDWEVIKESVGVEDGDSYLTAMRQDKTYGGEPEIVTLCTLLNVQAVIHLEGLNCPTQRRTYGPEADKCIQLVYVSDGNYDSGHYDLAVSTQEEAEEVNKIYETWRSVRVRQLHHHQAFEDNSTYDDSLLGQLMGHLQKIHENSSPNFEATYYPGRPIVCMYPDDSFYRAVVEEVQDDGIKVLYIDFGDSEKVQPDRIRTNNIMSEIPVQCNKFVLHDIVPNSVDFTWPVKTVEYIHNIVVTKQCTFKLQKQPESGQPMEVSIIMAGERDLSEHLLEMGMALRKSHIAKAIDEAEAQDNDVPADASVLLNVYQPMWDPYPGMISAVIVTHVESPNEVYLQRSLCENDDDPSTQEVNACLNKLATMLEELQDQAEFFPRLNHIKPGAACCALYSLDQRWYRGEVISMEMGSSPQVVVLFVDYGNKEFVSPEYVRVPPDDLVTLPAQASLCKLAGVCPPLGQTDWLPETKDALTDQVVGKCLVSTVKSLDTGVEVNLFEYTRFFEECLQERTDLLVYYPLLQAGLIQIHNVTEDGVVLEEENFT